MQPSVLRASLTAFVVALLVLAGCAATDSPEAAVPAGATASASCSNGETPLPVSGLCPSDAEALIHDADVGYYRSGLTELTDCTWAVNETAFPGGDVLLYRAASCDGTTAKLGFAFGNHTSDLYVETAALGVAGEDVLVGFVATSDADDPTANLLFQAREALEAEGADPAYVARCEVRTPADRPDAYVVDVPDPAPSPDGPRSDCGPLGYTDESLSFWRVAYGFSWFFELGQDAYHEIDPGSLTLVAQGADGAWRPVEPVAFDTFGAAPSAPDADEWPADNYGVTNVAGPPGLGEEVYGVEEPWAVYAGVDETGSDVLYCVAELEGGELRIGTDGGQWQLGVPHAVDLDSPGAFEIDGRPLPLSGAAANGWTFGWLTLGELDAIREGSVLVVEAGRASLDFDISGIGPALDSVTACTAELH